MLYDRPDEPARLVPEAHVRRLIIKGERHQDELTVKALLYLKKHEGKIRPIDDGIVPSSSKSD